MPVVTEKHTLTGTPEGRDNAPIPSRQNLVGPGQGLEEDILLRHEEDGMEASRKTLWKAFRKYPRLRRGGQPKGNSTMETAELTWKEFFEAMATSALPSRIWGRHFAKGASVFAAFGDVMRRVGAVNAA